MRIPGAGRIRLAKARIGRKTSGEAIILLYHRIADAPRDPLSLSVSPSHFDQHLEVVKRLGTPISMRELTACIKRGKLPRRAIALTFDDGYIDNLECAKPLLEKHQVPATVFVASGPVQSQQEFWWDTLEQLLFAPNPANRVLELTIESAKHRWQFDDSEKTLTTIYREIQELLRPLPYTEQQKLLTEIAKWANVQPQTRAEYRPMLPNEVAKLDSELVEIGAHTQTHPLLSAHSAQFQQQEILGGKAFLEEVLGRKVSSFAYPYGWHEAYNADTLRIVREAGFEYVPSNFSGVVWRGTDVHQMPRFMTHNWSGEELEQQIENWFAS